MKEIVDKLMENHRVYESNSDNSVCLGDLTEEEIGSLPDVFLCVTRRPGYSGQAPVFKNVTKNDLLKTPDKCFLIDSYWGYARARDIYLATRGEVEDAKKKELSSIEEKYKKYLRYVVL